MAGYCLHCRGTGHRHPSRERIAEERDAILIHVATGSFIRWSELTDAQRTTYRSRAVNARRIMAEYEGVI